MSIDLFLQSDNIWAHIIRSEIEPVFRSHLSTIKHSISLQIACILCTHQPLHSTREYVLTYGNSTAKLFYFLYVKTQFMFNKDEVLLLLSDKGEEIFKEILFLLSVLFDKPEQVDLLQRKILKAIRRQKQVCNICHLKHSILKVPAESMETKDVLLICDWCSRVYHLLCLRNPYIPIYSFSNWFCTECITTQKVVVSDNVNIVNNIIGDDERYIATVIDLDYSMLILDKKNTSEIVAEIIMIESNQQKIYVIIEKIDSFYLSSIIATKIINTLKAISSAIIIGSSTNKEVYDLIGFHDTNKKELVKRYKIKQGVPKESSMVWDKEDHEGFKKQQQQQQQQQQLQTVVSDTAIIEDYIPTIRFSDIPEIKLID
jgi:hypothetical protein